MRGERKSCMATRRHPDVISFPYHFPATAIIKPAIFFLCFSSCFPSPPPILFSSSVSTPSSHPLSFLSLSTYFKLGPLFIRAQAPQLANQVGLNNSRLCFPFDRPAKPLYMLPTNLLKYSILDVMRYIEERFLDTQDDIGKPQYIYLFFFIKCL